MYLNWNKESKTWPLVIRFKFHSQLKHHTQKRINNSNSCLLLYWLLYVLKTGDTVYSVHCIAYFVAFYSFACVFAQYMQCLLFDFVLIFIFCSVTTQRLLIHTSTYTMLNIHIGCMRYTVPKYHFEYQQEQKTGFCSTVAIFTCIVMVLEFESNVNLKRGFDTFGVGVFYSFRANRIDSKIFYIFGAYVLYFCLIFMIVNTKWFCWSWPMLLCNRWSHVTSSFQTYMLLGGLNRFVLLLFLLNM